MRPQPNARIACIGATHWDVKARVRSAIHMGTSLPVATTRAQGGVARNLAESLARLGHAVSLFSAVGADSDGDALIDDLSQLGIDVANIRRVPDRPTGRYTAVLTMEGALVLGLADMDVYDALDVAWANAVAPNLATHPVWLLDTNVTADAIEQLLRRHKGAAFLCANPVSVAKAERLADKLDAIDILVLDRAEAAMMSGMSIDDTASALVAAQHLHDRGVGTAILTLGQDGIVIADNAGGRHLPAPNTAIHDVTGAGDAFMAGYVHGLMTDGADAAPQYGIAAAAMALGADTAVPRDLTRATLAAAMSSMR